MRQTALPSERASNPSASTFLSLVVRATSPQMPRRAQVEAFSALVRRFQDMAVGYAFSRLGDFQLAEDAAQEAFVEAWENRGKLREPKAFAAWLRRIVLKRCDRFTRSKRLELTPMDEAADVRSTDPTPDEELERDEVRTRVLDAIRALPEHERTTTTLYYIGGYTQAEVADFLDAPLGTIKHRLHAARQRLQKGLMEMVRESLKDEAPSRDTAFEERIARLIQPQSMKTPEYQYGVEKVDGNDSWDLMKVCAEGDLAEVRRLLKKDARLANAQHWYQFPIHFAVREGHADIVKLLLDSGAEPGQSRYMHNSWQKLVDEAKRRGYDDALKVLESTLRERYGYDPEFEPLAQAIRDRDRAKIDAILAERPELAKAADALGTNAIHWAAHTLQPDLIDVFLERGADINAKRADGQTPAMMTINGDYWHRRWRILPEGANDDETTVLERLLERGAAYDLSVAIHMKDADRVRELLDANPESATQLDSSQRSYLFYAARAKRSDIAEMLLKRGADPSAPETLAPRGRALHEAATKSDVEMVRLLLKHGADPNGNVDSSGTALHISTRRNADGPDGAETRRLLIEHGAVTMPYDMTVEELRAALGSENPPIHDGQFVSIVFERDDPDLLRLLATEYPEALRTLPIVGSRYPSSPGCLAILLDSGADPNATDWFGKTWLHFAAGNGDIETARALIERGANVNAVEAEYRSTPLAEAVKGGHVEAVRFLLERGADPNAPEEKWARPLAWATETERGEVAELLKRHGAEA